MADDELYESFVLGKRDSFIRWAQAKLGSLDDARDVVNEAFFKLFLRWDDALSSANIDAFAFTILKGAIADALRKRDRSPCTLAGLEVPPSHQALTGIPDDEIEQITTRMEVHQAIAGLPARQQVCATLRYLLDMTTGEIASVTGMSPSTVRSHLSAARPRLAEAFAVPPTTTPANEKGSQS
ncbi:sigma-70 family RNA polymerase sigma factor [Streptomyces sp. DSM 44917]|uniref:Sigma-70 family RNA polymerase sigma factor n=1 Tax=Streptomyces boetiae TaxID=3075541 RepID=A0ABU2L6Y2_9ACTN|nr:sigma-70 family RNA polymerase sigma factor [Streptomyces sp. DSM 44917]MDT0307321.1 sigma-70 family RNA polymerase sigma factor [Streptomyces sp. DSM 44917]